MPEEKKSTLSDLAEAVCGYVKETRPFKIMDEATNAYVAAEVRKTEIRHAIEDVIVQGGGLTIMTRMFDRDAAVAMRAKGMTYNAIAGNIGVSLTTVYNAVNGHFPKRKRIDKRTAYRLREEGWKLSAIAEKFGVTVSSVCHSLKRMECSEKIQKVVKREAA